MSLYRFRLVPESPWLTPWQSDTLSGLLCWIGARTKGSDWLLDQIIQPALGGHPRFVLSDAFPGDWLPVPTVLRLAGWTPEQRKPVKRSFWIDHKSFRKWQCGSSITLDELIAEGGTYSYTQLRNCISRATGTTSGSSGLFPREEWVLGRDTAFLTVYARIDPKFLDIFWELVCELTRSGFGADISAGKGQFRLGSSLESASSLDDVENANGCAVLSTFQPSEVDPIDGYWESFTKYGKLGPDFGLENIFKRPLIMLRPGAYFRSAISNGWLGRAVPMRELLATDIAEILNRRGSNVIHYAFGLTVPSVSS